MLFLRFQRRTSGIDRSPFHEVPAAAGIAETTPGNGRATPPRDRAEPRRAALGKRAHARERLVREAGEQASVDAAAVLAVLSAVVAIADGKLVRTGRWSAWTCGAHRSEERSSSKSAPSPAPTGRTPRMRSCGTATGTGWRRASRPAKPRAESPIIPSRDSHGLGCPCSRLTCNGPGRAVESCSHV